MKVISVINPKGGAGKTVSAVNIAYALGNRNKKVLLIDTDPRGAIATYLNLKNEKTIFELIEDTYNNFGLVKKLETYINKKNNMDIIISNSKMINFDDFFKNQDDIEGQFKIFKEIKESFLNYDYVIIDTEGTVNNTIRAILNATDYIFAPTKVSFIDTNGLRDLNRIFDIGKRNNPEIKLEKVFCVQVEENTKVFKNTHKELEEGFEMLKEKYGKNVYSKIYVRKCADVLNSMEEHRDLFSYNKNSSACIDYKNLVDEFLGIVSDTYKYQKY